MDVIDHEAGTKSQTIIDLGPARSLHPQLQPVVNQSPIISISIKSVSAAAAVQVDFPDGQLSQRVRKLFSTKSQVSTTADLTWKPQDPSGTDANGILITAVASGDQGRGELNKDHSLEYGAEFLETDSCPKHAVSVMRWDACLFSNDVASRGLFPVVVNLENGELFAFNNHQLRRQDYESNEKFSEWLAMPGIGFLPNDVVDIITGGGGLLCVNGGIQPRKRNINTPPIPHAEDYNHRLYPQQSILVMCNPLTEEIKFLPRHSNKKLDDKIACLQVMKTNGPGNHGEKNPSSKTRLRYRLHVVGGHHERSSLRCPASDELVFMTYDSRSDTWISGMAVGRARIPALAKTGIASQEAGFYLGGQEESEEVIMVAKSDRPDPMPPQGRYCKRMSSRGQHHAAAGGRFRTRRVWINKIFYVQASTLKWHSVDFEILGEDGLPHREPLQAPRVVQCRPGGPV